MIKLGKPKQRYFDLVAVELTSAPPIPGLWARAYSDADGDEARAKALYIRYRASELEDDEANRLRTERDEQDQQSRARRESQVRQSRSARALAAQSLGVRFGLYILMVFGLLMILLAFAGLCAAVFDGQWQQLFGVAVFGILGVFAFRKARDGLAEF